MQTQAAHPIIAGKAIIPGIRSPMDLNSVRTLASDMGRETDRYRVQGAVREADLLQAATLRLDATVSLLAKQEA